MKNSFLKKIIEKILKESTNSIDRGSYVGPLVPGTKLFSKTQLSPFIHKVSKYDNSELAFDSYDGKLDVTKKTAKEMEKTSLKISRFLKNHPELTNSDEDGNSINPNGKIIEADTSISAGPYTGPIEIGMKKWKKSELGPFEEFVDTDINKKNVKQKLKNNIKKTVGMWEKGEDGTYEVSTEDTHTILEDLAVWFGTKKKPKGSKQPKGPWVNICRKKEGGGHPPCGRPDADSKGYPKCRAQGVASKMTDAQKSAACSQKRRAEKSKPKLGTGNSPTMTSYKPKKKNQNESFLIDLLIKSIKD